MPIDENNYDDEPQQVLLQNIKNKLTDLEKLLQDANSHWGYEDMIYRFYHGSFKTYAIQNCTNEIVTALQELSPGDYGHYFDDRRLGLFDSPWFQQIVAEGTGKKFDLSHNQDWLNHTRPMLEAFFHARFFLEMAVKYGKELEYAPRMLPSGWAVLLYLYNLR